MSLLQIATPAALIDEVLLARNIQRMQHRVTALGARLRPHVKTSKCLEVVRRQSLVGARGITVSTLKEAEEFFDAGFSDIFYAVAIAPDKLDRALALAGRGCALTLLVDSTLAARAIASRDRCSVDVMIEVDSDGHRSGVSPESDELIAIAMLLDRSAARLKGVMTHAGSSYELSDSASLRALAEQERSSCVRAAKRLRDARLACSEVSIGSTPTALSADNLDGVTEVRAGVYAFFDLVMVNVGICEPADLALSVLTTVIGHQRDRARIIVDAGWMAMSRDRGTQHQSRDFGYGLVCDLAGAPIIGLAFTSANQEHGLIDCSGLSEPDLDRFPIGARLRILPNHACATGAQFPFYQAVNAEGVVRPWARFNGW